MSVNDDEKLRAVLRQAAELSAQLNRMAGDTPVTLFSDYARAYMEAKNKRPKLRKSTKASFQNQVVNHLIPRFGALPLDKITNAIWCQWTEEEKGISKFFNARKALIEILTAAKEEGIVQKVPHFDNPDEYEPVGRVLMLEEIYAILRKATRPFRLIFYAFWKMGCRPREILQWEWSMIEWSRPKSSFAYIKIPARITKTGRAREIPIDPDLTSYLKIRHARGNGSIYVFPKRSDPGAWQSSYQSAWVTACRKAGVVNAMVYDFRRTFITRCAAAGKSMDFVAKQLDTSAAMIRRFYLKDDAETMEGLFT